MPSQEYMREVVAKSIPEIDGILKRLKQYEAGRVSRLYSNGYGIIDLEGEMKALVRYAGRNVEISGTTGAIVIESSPTLMKQPAIDPAPAQPRLPIVQILARVIICGFIFIFIASIIIDILTHIVHRGGL